MLSRKLQKALNDQIHDELGSAYLYLSMAAHFEAENLPGCATWMRRQAREEVGHAMRIFDFVVDRDGHVSLQAIEQPPAGFTSPLDAFEKSLANEQKVTGLIHKLYDLAQRENDYAAQVMLQWFVTEQVEEEKAVRTIVEQLQRIGTSSSAIFFFDRHIEKDAEEKGA